MKYPLHLLTMGLLSLSGAIATAQNSNVSTFEDVNLPGTDTTFLENKMATDSAGTYSFQSGSLIMSGDVSVTQFGLYWQNFDCSNKTDTITTDYTNGSSAIAGSGYDGSTNYGIAFLSANYPDAPTESIPLGLKITGEGTQSLVGFYITNIAYPYYYMQQNYSDSDYLKLIIRGYKNGIKSEDSVVFILGDSSGIVKNWTWVDLSSIGKVDSLTFQTITTDDWTPYYFAFDNFTTQSSTGIDIVQKDKWSISPNPAKDILHINTKRQMEILVYDMSGKALMEAHHTNTINISSLPAGMYILQMKDVQTHVIQLSKFVKQ